MKVKVIKNDYTAFYYSLGYITEDKVYEVYFCIKGRYYITDDDGDSIWFHDFELEFMDDD